MTNFMDNNFKNTLNFSPTTDWTVIQHFKKYQELLASIENEYKHEINSLNNIDCDGDNSLWNGMRNDINSLGLSTQIKNISDTLLKCEDCLFNESNPRTHFEPTFGKRDGIFAKMLNALDTGTSNFLQNYVMAKQVSKYECNFMKTFKRVQEIQHAIKDGRIVARFDELYTALKNDYENVKLYNLYHDYENSDNLQCTIKENMGYSYYNKFRVPDVGQRNRPLGDQKSFYETIRNYLASLKNLLTDLNTLIESMNGFFDMIYIGVKIIGALNIIFYADPEDQDMLASESQSTFESMVPLVTDDNTSEQHSYTLQQNTIWAMTISVPIAIEATKYVDDTRSNQATIFGSAVIAAFTSAGIQQRIDKLNKVLDAQHT